MRSMLVRVDPESTEAISFFEAVIYIYIIKKKKKTGHIRIINLFPSWYVFLKNPKTRKKIINKTSSDLMDKINQNRHRKEGGRG